MRNAYDFVVRWYWPFSLVGGLLAIGVTWLEQFHNALPVFLVAAAISFPCMVILALGSRERLAEVRPRPEEEILFSERNASGGSNRSLLYRFSGANRCLILQVSRMAIYIKPWGILGFTGDVFDMLHRIPLNDLLRCEINNRRVRIDWEGNTSGSVTVIPNDLASFKEAINKVRPGILSN